MTFLLIVVFARKLAYAVLSDCKAGCLLLKMNSLLHTGMVRSRKIKEYAENETS